MTTRRDSAWGFALLELLPAAALVLLAAMAAVAWMTRSTQHADWSRDKVFARQKAGSILSELRAYVQGGEGEVAADLDGFDDGIHVEPSLTIAPDPDDDTAFLAPDHPLSGNVQDREVWRWGRRITVRPFPGVNTRDLRICTVRMFRRRPGETDDGEAMAEVSTVIRTVGDAYPTTQVYDVYLLALENAPGWWVYMDAIKPFVEATFSDLESRNPGLVFRTHWVTTMGYGRDADYAPFTNEANDSLTDTPWTYVYPGRMPAGEAAQRYYVPERFRARMNLDGLSSAEFTGDHALAETFTDTDGDGRWGPGEPFVDRDGDGRWDAGNPVPYALADMHNHCMRAPDAQALFEARVAAGLDDEDTPSWRMLLDRMIAEPDRYHNAILINLHGELLPMPPARNVSDAAKDAARYPGWRAVTHPERLRPRRVAGNDASSDAPRFRVYAYKAEFHDAETVMTQREPFVDADADGAYDDGEAYSDWNGDGAWSAGTPISLVLANGDFTGAVNDATAPSLRVLRLAGGVDANGDGTADDYQDWSVAPVYPEAFLDVNADGICQVAEAFLDLDGDGSRDDDEPWQERDGDGVYAGLAEVLTDGNANGIFDPARPAETFTDTDGDGRWDAAEPYADLDKNGVWTAPTAPAATWRAWTPADALAPAAYTAAYGEPFLDLDGDETWDAAESLVDTNGNGVHDGGTQRGEMWLEAEHVAGRGTVLRLHGTPLETPYLDTATSVRKGLRASARLYDLDYVPCPTPSSTTGADRFERDLHTTSSRNPKNTARWIVELPLAAVRTALESSAGAGDGDAADRLLKVETRIGRDLSTGTRWPARHLPANLSTTYAWFAGSPDAVPFSERYLFQGDPRHSPYADTDARGDTAPHGYNWYFDDFQDGSYDYQGRWLAFDASRLRDRWMGRSCHDVPRLLLWLRTALARTEAVYTTLTGFSYYYLSLGGDVGYDAANGFPSSIPMSGTPFGLAGAVNENTITGGSGTAALRGSLKHVVSRLGSTSGIRSGGAWWSKPWLGELCPDSERETTWAAHGNLRASTTASAGAFRLARRADIPSGQQPRGTTLVDAYARLKEEGCTSLFNVGTPSSTFHHQYRDGQTGQLVEDGPQLAANYNFPLPTTTRISRPFGLGTSGSGAVGDEFAFDAAYPRFTAGVVRRFYDHQSGQTGSALLRLEEPSATRAGYVVVNGIDRTLESGSAFISRYAALTLIHGYFAAGAPGEPHRIRQLPRVQVRHPTLITELEDPATIDVRWSVQWRRWDGLPYTNSYPATHTEDEDDLVYVPMVSRDGGRSWLDLLTNEPVEPGRMPWIDGVGPDPARTVRDAVSGGDEHLVWATPRASYPEGSYLVRVEAYRASEALHFSYHQEKIHVSR